MYGNGAVIGMAVIAVMNKTTPQDLHLVLPVWTGEAVGAMVLVKHESRFAVTSALVARAARSASAWPSVHINT